MVKLNSQGSILPVFWELALFIIKFINKHLK